MLLSTRFQEKNSDRVQLNLYRLARQVGVMNNPDRYVEMTEMLLEAGLPGEAKSVMEAGFTSEGLRHARQGEGRSLQRRLDEAKAAAAKDQQALPAIEKEAQKSTTGQGDVALGMAYSSFGQYDKAVAALSAGSAEGRRSRPATGADHARHRQSEARQER